MTADWQLPIFNELYMQYVRPQVEFASPAWSPWTEADKEIIEKVQMKAIKNDIRSIRVKL